MSGRPRVHVEIRNPRGSVGFIDASGARWRADRVMLRPASALRVRRMSAGNGAPPPDPFLAVLYRRAEGGGFDVALFPGAFGGVAAGGVPADALAAVGPAPLPPEVRDGLLLLFAPVWWWRTMGREGPRVFSAVELGLGAGSAGGAA